MYRIGQLTYPCHSNDRFTQAELLGKLQLPLLELAEDLGNGEKG